MRSRKLGKRPAICFHSWPSTWQFWMMICQTAPTFSIVSSMSSRRNSRFSCKKASPRPAASRTLMPDFWSERYNRANSMNMNSRITPQSPKNRK